VYVATLPNLQFYYTLFFSICQVLQQKFLDCLVETQGNPKQAAELAGYSGNYHQVLKSLKEEVIDLASEVLARSAPRAAFKLIEVMESDRPVPQASNKLQAAQTILDRVGVAKTERINVNHTTGGGIFILPEKNDVTDADYEVIAHEDIPD
jgi:glycerate-2-kinase